MEPPQHRSDPNGEPPQKPDRLPQRWAIIIGLSGATGLTLAIQVDVTTGATAGLAVVGLLHAVMD